MYPSKIVGLQFGLLSPEEIKDKAVLEVTSDDTFEGGNIVDDGLFDLRMGPDDKKNKCKTCGLKLSNKDKLMGNFGCPGHFGYIGLVKPVWASKFIPKVRKTLQCVCVQCSRLLIDLNEEHKKNLDSLAIQEDKLNYISGLVGSNKVCSGEFGCGAVQPYISTGWLKVSLEYQEDDMYRKKTELFPEIALAILSRISNSDAELMGFNRFYSRPEWMIIQNVPVIPPCDRPRVNISDDLRQDSDLTKSYVQIIKWNKFLKKRISEENRKASVQQLSELTHVLNYYVASLVEPYLPRMIGSSDIGGRIRESIDQRIKGKSGRFRGNLMGKRVNYSGRSVIGGDPYINVDQLGIPLAVAMKLSFSEIVTKENIDRLRIAVRNGPKKYPGAILVEKGKQSYDLNSNNFEDMVIGFGDKVDRHLIEGDIIIANRQPTLHRQSMMAHRVKILPGSTLRLNLCTTLPYNADFDGDEMNIHLPRSLTTSIELSRLVSIREQIISTGTTLPKMHLMQDSLSSSACLTESSVRVSKKLSSAMLSELYEIVDIGELFTLLSDESISGRDIYSLVLPKVSFTKVSKFKGKTKNKDNNTVLVRNGRLIKGMLDKNSLGANDAGLVMETIRLFGNKKTCNMLTMIPRMLSRWFQERGFSTGVGNYMLQEKLNYKIIGKIINGLKEVDEIIDKAADNNLIVRQGNSIVQQLESDIMAKVNQISNTVGDIVNNEGIVEGNALWWMLNSGAKGSTTNTRQVSGCVGQIVVEGNRISRNYGKRSLPCYHNYDNSAVARGFVPDSFMSGLQPPSYFFHAIGGREGIIDTAIKTNKAGYIYIKLSKNLLDLTIKQDLSVRDGKGNIYQFLYANNGMDLTKIEKQVFEFSTLTNQQTEHIYKWTLEDCKRAYGLKEGTSIYNDKVKIDLMNEEYRKILEYQDHCRNEKDMILTVQPAKIRRWIVEASNLYGEAVDVISPDELINDSDKLFKDILSYYGNYENGVKRDLLENGIYKYRCLVAGSFSSKRVATEYKFSRDTVGWIFAMIRKDIVKGIAQPGEMVGIIAAQAVSEPTTQMQIDSGRHFAGVGGKTHDVGSIPRIEDIINARKNIEKKFLKIYLKSDISSSYQKVLGVLHDIEEITLSNITLKKSLHVVKDIENYADKLIKSSNINSLELKDKNLSNIIIKLELNESKMVKKQIRSFEVSKAIGSSNNSNIISIQSNENMYELILFVNSKFSNNITSHKELLQNMNENIIIKGIRGVRNLEIASAGELVYDKELYYRNEYYLEADGNNLSQVLAHPLVDKARTISNDIIMVSLELGIEAARNLIISELKQVYEAKSAVINISHYELLASYMTRTGLVKGMNRYGMKVNNGGIVSKAAFEQQTESLVESATSAELDNVQSVAGSLFFGQNFKGGSADSKLMLSETTGTLKVESVLDNIF